MHTRTRVILASAVALSTCACSDSDDDRQSFNQFVRQLVNQTSETSEPVSLDGREFSFNENPNAFDALFE
jgi:hypothetical protein